MSQQSQQQSQQRSQQLVIHFDANADNWHWCHLDRTGQPLSEARGDGDLDDLAQALGEGIHQAWLMISGNRVVTREVPYAKSEKRHLRRLLPYQLEETLIGDVDRFHFALGPMGNDRAAIAYVEKAWLRQLFDRLATINVEITHCWPAPLLLPLPAPEDSAEKHWVLRAQGDHLWVRHGAHLGFCGQLSATPLLLQLLMNTEEQVEQLPQLHLQATDGQALEQLERLLPVNLAPQVVSRSTVDFWDLDFDRAHTNLSQGDFSQRLPIERWWRQWQTVAVVASVCLVTYVGVLMFQVNRLEQEHQQIRQNTEAIFRSVVPRGPADAPERRLNVMARDLQPAGAGGQAMDILAQVLPVVAATEELLLRNLQYTASSGELNANIQADNFSAIEALRTGINQRGLHAELLGTSVQGDIHSARVRISRGEGS